MKHPFKSPRLAALLLTQAVDRHDGSEKHTDQNGPALTLTPTPTPSCAMSPSLVSPCPLFANIHMGTSKNSFYSLSCLHEDSRHLFVRLASLTFLWLGTVNKLPLLSLCETTVQFVFESNN